MFLRFRLALSRLRRRIQQLAKNIVTFLFSHFRHSKTPELIVYQEDNNSAFLGLTTRVPENEQEDAWHINTLFSALDQYVNQFRAALSLYQTAANYSESSDGNRQRLFHAWQFIACRDAVITIYNLAECIQAIKMNSRDHPTINAELDWDSIRKISKQFKKEFPSYDKLRHGVAHASGLIKTKNEQDSNAIKKEYTEHGIHKGSEGDMYISNSLYNDTFMTTHQGHMRTCDITEETLIALESIRDQLIGVFEKLPRNTD